MCRNIYHSAMSSHSVDWKDGPYMADAMAAYRAFTETVMASHISLHDIYHDITWRTAKDS